MKDTIKLAAIGAAALAVSTTSALAGPTLPAGVTTGIALGAPLPEGIYDISIGSYGTRNDVLGNLAYAIPVWLIWSTPWQIFGGRIGFDSATGVADVWTPGNTYHPAVGIVPGYQDGIGTDSWLNTLMEGSIAWSFGNGWNASLRAGAWLNSTQTLPMFLGRDYTAFMGGGSISYVANGWNLTATALYGSGGNGDLYKTQNPWINLDLTATRKFGKAEMGVIAYGSWDTECAGGCWAGNGKSSEFAIGGLVGYDFGSFIMQAKLAADVDAGNIYQIPGYDAKEVRGTINIIKPLWNPAPPLAPLK